MKRHRAESLVSYLELIGRIREHFAADDPTTPVWFRGHSDSSWQMLPTLYRGVVDPYWERELLRDFKLRSGTLLSQSPANDLEWLYLMRHHGGPTRILDWSESPLVALFFALRESTGSTAACVWVLRPWSLNEASLKWKSVPTTDNELLSRYTLNNSGGNVARSVEAPLPAAVRPQHAIHRAVGQSGMFTIHGKATDPLEKISRKSKGESWLQKIEIPAESCTQIFGDLFDAGITTSSIFPDLDGLTADLCYRYSQRRTEMQKKSSASRSRSVKRHRK